MKLTRIALLALMMSLAMTMPVFAQSEGVDHGSMNPGDSKHRGHDMGVLIHQLTVKGFKLSYHLIDVREKMKKLNLPSIKDTHHLMVYLENSQGQKVTSGKVGYLLKSPAGNRQKVMAMAMAGGFGADIDLSQSGTYTIKTKVLSGSDKLMSAFNYTVD